MTTDMGVRVQNVWIVCEVLKVKVKQKQHCLGCGDYGDEFFAGKTCIYCEICAPTKCSDCDNVKKCGFIDKGDLIEKN